LLFGWADEIIADWSTLIAEECMEKSAWWNSGEPGEKTGARPFSACRRLAASANPTSATWLSRITHYEMP
jgi:hypothetical protein